MDKEFKQDMIEIEELKYMQAFLPADKKYIRKLASRLKEAEGVLTPAFSQEQMAAISEYGRAVADAVRQYCLSSIACMLATMNIEAEEDSESKE